MKKSRLVIVIVAVVLLLCTGFAYRYLSQHAMAKSASYETGMKSLPAHVLIATQGSPFKDRLVEGLVSQLKARPAYVKVIDVTELPGIEARDWQAIVIVHTWEFGKPPRSVSDFSAHVAARDKVVAVTTSGSGREKLPGVDVVSSASVLDDLPELLRRLGTRIETVLARNSAPRESLP